ncbi:hypothetical protein OQJ18_15105 [Fluoribacter dumoffii]|uniref:Macrophage killing protein with similarity to conjugation protein n=1 Tax=Fluoribacter dumoffii TaxID=463 RepID=A0A377GD53_9GAMM|nr:hypothetical protein [Fluoribacter dumoffii]KTC90817.1 Macrophage killing protein with similarity to conjugation protein [Fluoribacter dumoffii NY 23]MCW8386660.1 hypothetical protein [Fluoribacter dumoffii]MCW8419714.1 hypothetical protein [Fluoribacter dumoffii]MCW8455583.1 hypothetical protein [Fluoribacter dumoffii]MCW8460338.1 hypothetical protein [Fluoribacter dumoffii]
MKPLWQGTLLWFMLLISPLTLYAQDETDVCQWVKQILTTTLSVDYTYEPANAAELKKNYSLNAWNALSSFLGSYVEVIKEQHLTLHPKFIKDPEISEQGIVSGITYWRVDEVVSLPELNLTIAFSLLIIKTNPSPYGHFLIQSINMLKKENS